MVSSNDHHGAQPSATEPCGMRDSPLGRLPPELRNNIWELVFTGLWDNVVIRPLVVQQRTPHPRLALLLACRNIFQEAQGYAWQDVRAAIDYLKPTLGNSTRHPPPTEIRKAMMMFEADIHIRRLLVDLGHRLHTIVALDCKDSRTCVILGGEEHDAHAGGALSHAAGLLWPKLTGLKRVQLQNGDAHLVHSVAVGQNPFAHLPTVQAMKERLERVTRQYLYILREHLPSVTELEVCDSKPFLGVAVGSIEWRISKTCFTHLASGTVWDIEAEIEEVVETSVVVDV